MKKILLTMALSLLMLEPAAARPPGDEGAGHASRGQLPPGLQKKGTLPPGWERKLNKGARLDDELYAHAVPLSAVEVARLPPAPSGFIQLRIENQVVQLDAATRRISAVLRLP